MPDHPDPHTPDGRRSPEFGPGGYLPQRAARRARKIILREQMGLGWPAAAVGASLLVLLAGLAFLLLRTGPPGSPFAAAGELAAVEAGGVGVVELGDTELLVVRSGGGVRVYLAPAEAVDYCQASGRLEGADGTVWNLAGRRVGGSGDSLAPVPGQVHRGVLYADPTGAGTPPPPAGAEAEPECASRD
ncbi:hypothetical protein BH20ACT8_BH20ACT8_05100 [soil metagenome]